MPVMPVPPPAGRAHLRAVSGGRASSTPARRILVELVESRRSERAAWTADLRATGIPALHAEDGTAIHVGWHTELSSLVEEIHRILSALRQWWPELAVHTTLKGSAGAARKVAALHDLDLPR